MGLEVASPSVSGHVHLRLDGWFDSPRAFLPPLPDFLSVAFFPPPELLLFFPFFTTSHLPNEPLLEAISELLLGLLLRLPAYFLHTE